MVVYLQSKSLSGTGPTKNKNKQRTIRRRRLIIAAHPYQQIIWSRYRLALITDNDALARTPRKVNLDSPSALQLGVEFSIHDYIPTGERTLYGLTYGYQKSGTRRQWPRGQTVSQTTRLAGRLAEGLLWHRITTLRSLPPMNELSKGEWLSN